MQLQVGCRAVIDLHGRAETARVVRAEGAGGKHVDLPMAELHGFGIVGDEGRAGKGGGGEAKEGKNCFFEKKPQKTLARLSRTAPAACAKWPKFFGSFFQKRTAS